MVFLPGKRSFYIAALLSLVLGLVLASAPDTQDAAEVVAQGKDIVFGGKSTSFYAAVAKENLKSLASIQLDKGPDALNALLSDEKEFHEVLYEKSRAQLNPNEWIKRSAVFNLLCQRNLENTNVLDEKTWQDLEILCGPKSDPMFYLASKIDRTYTQMGKAALFCKMVNPTCTIEQLENQQAIVKELVKDAVLFDELDKQLKELALPENAMLSFWTEDTFYALMQDKKIKIPLFKKIEAYLNKNEFALEINDKLDIFTKFTQVVVTGIGIITLPVYALALVTDSNWTNWLKEKMTK